MTDHDKHYKVYGHGPLSLLEVTPLSAKYFGFYTCQAENIHGVAEHEIELILARNPTEIQQAVLDRVTSTTLHYRFVPPVNTGGLPLDAYAVEYKETRHQWDSARRRVWPIGECSLSLSLFSIPLWSVIGSEDTFGGVHILRLFQWKTG